MDTATFLSHILPKQGFKFIVIREAEDKPWVHKPTESCSVAADIAEQADANGRAVYHACASFKAAYVETGEMYDNGRPKRRYRIEDNAGWVKSFWLDLDCGECKDYPSQRDAVTDVVRFCKESGLPRPLLVNSGNGVHCYWVLEEQVSAVNWKRIASVFRAVVDHFGVKHDSVCTTDVCRILRPVGTTNRKRGEKPVKLLGPVPDTIQAATFVSSLMELVKANAIGIKQQAAPARPSFLGNASLNNDLSAGTEYPPSSAHEIARHCAQVRDFRDAKGDVTEPLWYAMLGLLKHTVESNDVCHEWSEGHPAYDRDSTERKIIQWAHGPSTCERFKAINPAACEGCPHAKVKSPIQLGTVVEQSVPVVDANPVTGEIETLPEIPESMRDSYAWTGSYLMRYERDANGVVSAEPVSKYYVFPIGYHDNIERKMEYTWMLREGPGKYRQFTVRGSDLYNGGKDLAKVLGDQGLAPMGGGGKKYMNNYINDWWTELRNSTEATQMFTTFGWHGKDFVLGGKLFRADGEIRDAHITGSAHDYCGYFEPSGTLEEWKAGINELYNRPEHEQFQWMFGVGFGAPLVKLMGGNIAGCAVAAYSPETAQGKSTAGKLAIGIYGDPDRLSLTQQAATFKGTFGYIGLMNSLPVLLDEVTNSSPREMSDMLYQFSQGSGRVGANSDGTLRKTVNGWSTLMAMTANKSAMNSVSANSINAESEMARVFEYKFTTSRHQMSTKDAANLVPKLLRCTGHAGQEYIAYVVRNREAVIKLIGAVRDKLIKEGRVSQGERFWLHGSVAIYTGLLIAKKIGLIDFDLKALWVWVIDRIDAMRGQVRKSKADPMEQFGRMLSDIHGRILTTNNEGDARGAAKTIIIREPNSSSNLAGRFVQETGELWLTVKAFGDWCEKNRADPVTIMTALEDAGVAKKGEVQKLMSKGLNNFPLPRMRCFVIDMRKADIDFASVVEPAAQLRVVNE